MLGNQKQHIDTVDTSDIWLQIWLLWFQGPGIMEAGWLSGLTGGLYFSELVKANLFPLHLSQHKVASGLEVI